MTRAEAEECTNGTTGTNGTNGVAGSAGSGRGKHPLLKVARIFLGALLLVAALLKIWQWIAEPIAHGPFLQVAIGHGAVCLELLLALWLLSGVLPLDAVRIAGACFALFTAVSLWKISHGLGNCGCFGALAVSPRLTYWIDCGALLLAWRAAVAPCRMRLACLAAVLVIFAVLQGGAVFFAHKNRVGTDGTTGADGMIGRGNPRPLSLQAMSAPADLTRGRWVVVVYDSSCHRCLSYAAEYARLAREWRGNGKKLRVALIDAAADPVMEKPWKATDVVEGSLQQLDLYRHTPLIVVFENGRPAAVHEEWDQIDWSKPPFSQWAE